MSAVTARKGRPSAIPETSADRGTVVHLLDVAVRHHGPRIDEVLGLGRLPLQKSGGGK